MKRFVEGKDRRQTTLLPDCVDDYVSEENPVRAIDAFVDALDLAVLCFEGAVPEATGRPAYHPGTLLKIYLYGYLNRIQLSRRLEREAHRNLELMWLTGRLAPDFKTIADFRKDNGPAIRATCRRRFAEACSQLDRGIALDDVAAIPGHSHAQILLYTERPGVVCRLYAAMGQWLFGYPDRGLATIGPALAFSQRLSHPHSLAFCLSFASVMHIWRREFEAARRRAEAAIAVAHEHRIPLFVAMAMLCRGAALTNLGQLEAGIANLQEGRAEFHVTGARLWDTMWLGFTAQAHALAGRIDAALVVLDRAEERAAVTSEVFYRAELHRLRGALHRKRSDAAEAQHWLEEALRLARSQGAKSLELRSATSLARLWRDQRRRTEARELLAPILGWFSEGFGTPDLKAARAVLDEVCE